MTPADSGWDVRLRGAGLRSTVQRRAVLQALVELRHATVDELAATVQRRHPDVNLSTIYRTLDVLDEAGLVTHAHLHHGSPTYHSVEGAPHLHLVCTECGRVDQQPIAVAGGLADELRRRAGFVMDVTHLAVHGRCAACGQPDAEDTTAPVSRGGAEVGSDPVSRTDAEVGSDPVSRTGTEDVAGGERATRAGVHGRPRPGAPRQAREAPPVPGC